MLRLEKVEICGFKSFSDRTEVLLPSGITAVVGPNGCGKSNIGDAINWVLGEQSPKMLRGKQMADVIFNGSAGRKPNGMAEVTLILERQGRPQVQNGNGAGGSTYLEAYEEGEDSEPSEATEIKQAVTQTDKTQESTDEPSKDTLEGSESDSTEGTDQASTQTDSDQKQRKKIPHDIVAAVAHEQRIRITRRLFRSGESEYLVNGKKSRLKDIQEILRNERVGAKTYATIEQGRIEQILNAKPKERRLVIEEAAGIAGFKHKRRLTEMKLEATEANLLRVQDVIREVTRQINSLKRQAAKARRYQRHREDLRGLLQLRYATRTAALDAELEAKRKAESNLKMQEAEAASALGALESGLAEARQLMERHEEAYREISDALHQFDLEIDRAVASQKTAEERIEESTLALERAEIEERQIHERLGSWTARRQEQEAVHADLASDIEERRSRLEGRQHEWANLQRQLQEARQALDTLGEAQLRATHEHAESKNKLEAVRHALRQNQLQVERLIRQRSETEEDQRQLASAAEALLVTKSAYDDDLNVLSLETEKSEQRLETIRGEHQSAVQALAATREEAKSAQARWATLQDVANRFTGETDGTRTILSRAPEEGIRTRGVVADFIQVEPAFERAAESYLSTLLPAVIVEEPEDAKRSAALMGREGTASTRMLCRSLAPQKLAFGADRERMSATVAQEIRLDHRVLGSLKERLTLATEANGALEGRIGDAFLVTDLDAALELHRRYQGFDFLTPTGEVVYADGVIVAGGGGEARDGVLAHTRKIQEAKAKWDTAEERVAVAKEEEAQCAHKLQEQQLHMQQLRQRLEEGRRRQVEVELKAQRLDEDKERSLKQHEVIEAEWNQLHADREELERQAELGAEAVDVAAKNLLEIEEQLEAARAEVTRVNARVEEATELVGSAREDLAARTQRQEALGHELSRLNESLRESRERLDVVREQATKAKERRAENQAIYTTNETKIAELSARRQERSKEALDMEHEIREHRLAVQEQESSLSKDRTALDRLRESLRGAELERTRCEADREHLAEQAMEEFGQSLELTLAEVDPERLAESNAEEVELEIDELKAKIEKIGPVNILAIDEFSDLEERQQFLAEQKEDLEKSIASLKETIRKINRNSRDRFVEAFETIRSNFQEIYQSLFNGGRADLRLEEDEDVLEAGIEIFSQPPGKRLGSVQLLSGGEKAMSAIALLFAIFRYQPSPFCLLDEVDAPLDDVNVGRFTRMLRDYASNTQFILITHNKLSMESADLLYGVTMEEPGVSRLMSMQLQ